MLLPYKDICTICGANYVPIKGSLVCSEKCQKMRIRYRMREYMRAYRIRGGVRRSLYRDEGVYYSASGWSKARSSIDKRLWRLRLQKQIQKQKRREKYIIAAAVARLLGVPIRGKVYMYYKVGKSLGL